MLTIDGSQGEGGGQILRTSLALAIITRRPIRIENIRANRDKPGLRQQHLTAVNAAALICHGQLEAAKVGSRKLTFSPGEVCPGDYQFDIGTAGSTTLVLQTLLPPLMLADTPSTLSIIGGTHNPFAPPVDFLQHSFLSVLATMGLHVDVQLERYGFYPAGGGRILAKITPGRLSPLELSSRGELLFASALAIVAGLPPHVGERELTVVANRLNWPAEQLQLRHIPHGVGLGNALTLMVQFEQVTEVVTGFGEKGVPAETVAAGACDEMEAYLGNPAPVGEHLADQLLLPLALAGGGSFVTRKPSLHAKTNMAIIQSFLPVKFSTEWLDDERVRISVVRQS